LQVAQANAKAKTCKRACKANAKKNCFKKIPNAKKNKTPDTQARLKKHSTNDTNGRHKNDCNPRQTRTPAYNSTYKKVAVQCSTDTFVVNQNLVLRINICGENRHLRQARKHCMQVQETFCK